MSKRQEIRDKQRQREKTQRIIAIVCLVIFAVAVVLLLMTFILPKFMDMFKDLGIKER